MPQYDEDGTEISEQSMAALHRLNTRLIRGVVPDVVLQIAIEQANQSRCLSKRGAVIWADVQYSSQPLVMGRGFNKHSECDQTAECKVTCRLLAVHAEQAALMDALWNSVHVHSQRIFLVHVKTKDRKLVQSGEPSCAQCSKMLVFSPMRISGVYLYHEGGFQFYETKEFHRQSMQNERSRSAAPVGSK